MTDNPMEQQPDNSPRLEDTADENQMDIDLIKLTVVENAKQDIDTQVQSPKVQDNVEHRTDQPSQSTEVEDIAENKKDKQPRSPKAEDGEQKHGFPPRFSAPPSEEDEMTALVTEMEAAFAACLPQEELREVDHLAAAGPQNVDAMRRACVKCPADEVNKTMKKFLEAAYTLKKYFTELEHLNPPPAANTLREEIASMEEELRVKEELIKKHSSLLEGWKKEIEEQLDKHIGALKRV